MSELKAFNMPRYAGEFTIHEVYLKSEADKVIAELKKKLDLYKRGWEEADKINAYLYAQRHHKYKRCLAMAMWCDAMKSYFKESGFFDVYSNERMVFYERWHNRWLKIAEQFKDKEAK